MNSVKIDDILASVRATINKPDEGFSDFIRMEKNKTYIGRFVPNLADPSASIFNCTVHGWNSELTGKYFEFINPETFDLPNPIRKISYEEWDKVKHLDRDHPDRTKVMKLFSREIALANFYIISDETNPENNGKVKRIKLNKTLRDIVEEAFSGEEKEDFGSRIFDLSPNGCNFRIRVGENSGGWAEYSKSRFMMPSAIEGIETDEDIKNIWKQSVDLKTVYPIKTYDEIKEILEKHYFTNSSDSVEITQSKGGVAKTKNEPAATVSDTSDLLGDIDLDDFIESGDSDKPKSNVKESKKKTKKPDTETKSGTKDEVVDSSDDDFDIDDYLEGLED